MPTFGFSAFLKLLSLNDKPQTRELKQRYLPRSGGGYDFHRSLRLLARRFLLSGEEIEGLLKEADRITKAAEARSARDGLERLRDWRAKTPETAVQIPPKTFESPSRVFKVHFTPDMGFPMSGGLTAIHIWNTARPPLVPRMVYSSLALFADAYDGERSPPTDFGVLSLPDRKLYRLSDVGDFSLIAARLITVLEQQMEAVRDELGLPRSPRDDGSRPTR